MVQSRSEPLTSVLSCARLPHPNHPEPMSPATRTGGLAASRPTVNYREALRAESRLFLATLLGTLLVCTLIALVLGRYVPAVGGFHHAWVNSICIGLLAFSFINVPRVLLWPRRAPPLAGLLALLIVGIPAALFIGAYLAAYFTGEPADWLWEDSSYVRNAAIAATIGATLLITAIVWFHQYTAMLRLQAELEQTRAEAANRLADEAQLRLLRAQLDPHMLFNTLATLRTLISNDPTRAQAMLDDLVSLLRATLIASRRDILDLATEFTVLTHYLRLMAIRLGPRLRYTLQLAPEVEHVRLPALLLQPLVENAIRHGIEPSPDPGEISVVAERIQEQCHITIVDNGVGLYTPPLPGPTGIDPVQASGFGLEAVRARLRAAWGDAASLTITSPAPEHRERGTHIVMTFPAAERA